MIWVDWEYKELHQLYLDPLPWPGASCKVLCQWPLTVSDLLPDTTTGCWVTVTSHTSSMPEVMHSRMPRDLKPLSHLLVGTDRRIIRPRPGKGRRQFTGVQVTPDSGMRRIHKLMKVTRVPQIHHVHQCAVMIKIKLWGERTVFSQSLEKSLTTNKQKQETRSTRWYTNNFRQWWRHFTTTFYSISQENH